jgi:uncharacterized protein
MDIEFDAAKDAFNVEKHGVSLAFGARLFNDADVITSHRPIDREKRFKVIGLVEVKLWTAVYGYARLSLSLHLSAEEQ